MKPLSITCNLDWLGLSRRVIFIWKENLGQAFRKFDIIFARASNFVLKGNLIYSACNYSKLMAESPKVTTENDLRISYIWSCKACVKFEWFSWFELQNWRPFPGSLWPSSFPTDPLKLASKQQPIHMKMWQKALKYFGFPLADTAHFEIN